MNCWVIPCRYDGESVHRCVESIRTHHPADRVIVVDSCSDDLTYLASIDIDYVVTGNRHYCPGAWRHALDIGADWYGLIHDSLEIVKPLDQTKPLQVVRWFPECRTQLHPNMYRFCAAHADVPVNYRGVFGPMLFCDRSTLDQLDQRGFFDLQPTDRVEANGCERLAGIMLEQAGWDLSTVPTLQGVGGMMHDPSYSDEWVRKHYRDRP